MIKNCIYYSLFCKLLDDGKKLFIYQTVVQPIPQAAEQIFICVLQLDVAVC